MSARDHVSREKAKEKTAKKNDASSASFEVIAGVSNGGILQRAEIIVPMPSSTSSKVSSNSMLPVASMVDSRTNIDRNFDTLPPVIIENGSWHMRIGTGDNNVAIGPNQIGMLSAQPSTQPFFWRALQTLLDNDIGRISMQLYFPQRLGTIEHLPVQREVWKRALSYYKKVTRDGGGASNGGVTADEHGTITAANNSGINTVANSGINTHMESSSSMPVDSSSGIEESSIVVTSDEIFDIPSVAELNKSFTGKSKRRRKDLIRLHKGVKNNSTRAERFSENHSKEVLHSSIREALDSLCVNQERALEIAATFQEMADLKVDRVAVLPSSLMAFYDPCLRISESPYLTSAQTQISKGHDKVGVNSTNGRVRQDHTAVNTMLILDLGFSSARILAIVNGEYNPLDVRKAVHLGGYYLTQQLQQHLNQRHDFKNVRNFSIYASDVLKQEIARVHGREMEPDDDTSFDEASSKNSMDFRWDLSLYDFSKDPSTLEKLREKTSNVQLLKEWVPYQLGEMLFRPIFPGLPGLADLVMEVIDSFSSTPEHQHLLCQNIVVVGGTSRILGLGPRLEFEIRKLITKKVKVKFGNELSIYRGTVEYVNKFPDSVPWITREDVLVAAEAKLAEIKEKGAKTSSSGLASNTMPSGTPSTTITGMPRIMPGITAMGMEAVAHPIGSPVPANSIAARRAAKRQKR